MMALTYPADDLVWPEDAAHDAALAAEDARSRGRYAGTRPNQVSSWSGSDVLITAPHAVTHWRSGVRKDADVATGFLAQLIAHHTGAASLIAEGEQHKDGNFDAASPFRRHLGMFLPDVRAVVDVHGMSDNHGPDVCLGRGRVPALSRELHESLHTHLTAAGFTVATDDPFDGDGHDTVTRACHEHGTPAIQIEVARRLRQHVSDPEPCLLLAWTVARAVDDVCGEQPALLSALDLAGAPR